MSFLFKSSKQKGGAVNNALPPASRDIRSSDGPNASSASSQIPTLNGIVSASNSKPSSPTPGASVNNSLNSVSAGDGARPGTPGSRPQQEDWVAQNGDGVKSPEPTSAEQKSMRDQTLRGGNQDSSMRSADTSTRGLDPGARSMDRPNGTQEPPRQRLPVQAASRPLNDPSPYPWSSRPLTFTVSHTNPFPRYGAAVNATSSKDGSIYLMGGLINGSTVKGDLWMVEAGTNTLSCFPVATTSEGPGPRVGHASLLVGNAFIVFGGDTKMDEGDQLDDTLYLLNTSTKQWSRALPAGPRPPGRYGHTLNILGSKIYIFGGQVEGYFFNDLVAFDLNALQQATNRWEILIQNTIDGGPPHGQIPPARTNHTMITWGDKLYLFGGTDGIKWFNDVWSYSPHTNSWTQLECIGYIPSPREGHAASLVGDVMYIFGGRTEEGTDLGDLAAFRISSRRWYTFQNMGPSPSPRSGHSMTTVGKSIVVLAGEPSSAPRDPVELAIAYFLDTGKIRYPPDTSSPPNNGSQIVRRPSTDRERTGSAPTTAMHSPKPQGNDERSGSANDVRDRSESIKSSEGSRIPQARPQQQTMSPVPPQSQSFVQQRPNGVPTSRQPTKPERALSPAADRSAGGPQGLDRAVTGSPQAQGVRASSEQQDREAPSSPGFSHERSYYDSDQEKPRTYKPQTYQPSQEQASDGRSASRNQKHDLGRISEVSTRTSEGTDRTSKDRELQAEDDPQDSGIGSSPAMNQRYDELARQLEQAKQRNAWYASELALARKSGYQTRAAESPAMDERAPDVFGEEDKPLIEALLKMKAELARVQDNVDEQSKSAAQRIAEMEKQRDAAISEAIYAKTRLAGHGSPQPDGESQRSLTQDRDNDMGRRLVSSLNTQGELNKRIDAVTRELEAERQSRQLAEETAEAAQKRAADLDSYRQQHGSELDSLRNELHEAQRGAREATSNHAEIRSQHELLMVDKREVDGRLESALAASQNHSAILTSLRDAVNASTEKAQMLEQRLAEEHDQRDDLERNLRELSSEHDEQSRALDSTSRRLKDAEALAEKHAQEAESHRSAVLAGLGKVNDRHSGIQQAADERVTLMRQQIDEANGMARQHQDAADTASEKLRRAEERIAGLEAFQEQASREGLSIRKQLQATMKESQSLSTQKTELEQKLQSQMLETNALAVQHSSLRDVLGERGINAAEVRRSRAMDSPSNLSRFSTPELHRVRELEQQLDASLKSHDEMKQQFEEVSQRDEKMKREYEEKLTALANDHQAAMDYLRGSEKMITKMKQERQRIKDDNRDLQKKLDRAKDENEASKRNPPSDWEAERDRLKKEISDSQDQLKTSVTNLETQLSTMQQQMQNVEGELQQTRNAHATAQADLSTMQATHSQSRGDIEKLQKDNTLLEERARDAENKVQLLLDQVESSVDNYRRASAAFPSNTSSTMMNGITYHDRPLSSLTETTANNDNDSDNNPTATHSRNLSQDTTTSNDVGRNSLALDSLASELETLRSHWETTNKSYRLSDKFDFERTPIASSSSTAAAGARESGRTTATSIGGFGSLNDWRRGISEEDEGEEELSPVSDDDDDNDDDAGTPTRTQTQTRTSEDKENRAPSEAV